MPKHPPRNLSARLAFRKETKAERELAARVHAKVHDYTPAQIRYAGVHGVYYSLAGILFKMPAKHVLGEQKSDITPQMLLAIGQDPAGQREIYPRENAILARRETYALFELLRVCTDADDISPLIHVMDWLHERSYILPDRVWRDMALLSHLLSDDMHERLGQHAYFNAHPTQLTLLQTHPKKTLTIVGGYHGFSMDRRIQETCDALGVKPIPHSHYLNKMELLLWADKPYAVFGKNGVPLSYLLVHDSTPIYQLHDEHGLQSRYAFLRLVEMAVKANKPHASSPYFKAFVNLLSYLHKHNVRLEEQVWKDVAHVTIHFDTEAVNTLSSHPYWQAHKTVTRYLRAQLVLMAGKGEDMDVVSISDGGNPRRYLKIIKAGTSEIRRTQDLLDKLNLISFNPDSFLANMSRLLKHSTLFDLHIKHDLPLNYLVSMHTLPLLTESLSDNQAYPFFQLVETCATYNGQRGNTQTVLDVLDYLHTHHTALPDQVWQDVSRFAADLHPKKRDLLMSSRYWDTNPEQLKLFLPNTTKENTMEMWDGGGVWSAPEDTFKPEVRALYDRAKGETGKTRIATLVEACQLQQDFTPLDDMIGDIDKQGDNIVSELPQTVGEAFDLMGKSFMETREMANAIRPSSYPYALKTPEPKGLVQKAMARFGWTPDKVSSKPKDLSPTEQYERTTQTLRKGIDQFTDAKNVLRRHNERGRGQAAALELLAQDIRDYIEDPANADTLTNDRMLAKELNNHMESLAENARLMTLCAQTSEHAGERVTDVGHELNKTLKVVNVAMTIHTAGRLPDAEATARSLQGAQVKMLKAANDIMHELVLVADLTRDDDPARTQARLAEGENLREELKRLLTPPAPAVSADAQRNNAV